MTIHDPTEGNTMQTRSLILVAVVAAVIGAAVSFGFGQAANPEAATAGKGKGSNVSKQLRQVRNGLVAADSRVEAGFSRLNTRLDKTDDRLRQVWAATLNTCLKMEIPWATCRTNFHFLSD